MNKLQSLRTDLPAMPESAGPLHRRLADLLRASVRGGALAAGDAFPTEQELAAAYGMSRGTVRQALARLRAEGVITGGRGRPPVVRSGPLAQPFEALVSFTAWAQASGLVPSGRVISSSIRPATAEAAEALGLATGTRVHQLVRLRLADGRPVLVERTVFAPAVGEAVAAVDLERGSIYASLAERGIRFDAAHQTIDAVAATALDAELLEVRRGAPLLRVRRRSETADGQPLEWADDRYRPDRMTLTIDQLATSPGMARTLSQGGR
jgi:GntR family transcriptional regulator